MNREQYEEVDAFLDKLQSIPGMDYARRALEDALNEQKRLLDVREDKQKRKKMIEDAYRAEWEALSDDVKAAAAYMWRKMRDANPNLDRSNGMPGHKVEVFGDLSAKQRLQYGRQALWARELQNEMLRPQGVATFAVVPRFWETASEIPPGVKFRRAKGGSWDTYTFYGESPRGMRLRTFRGQWKTHTGETGPLLTFWAGASTEGKEERNLDRFGPYVEVMN